MDNVVQNINMEDIIPSKFQPNKEEENKIIDLAQLIKSFGILDPLLVRPQNGKYEIILGQDRYQAAKIAGLNTIPALVKEINDEAFSKYLHLDSGSKEENNLNQNEEVLNNSFTNPLEQINPNENMKKFPSITNLGTKTNSDIVNLSELNQKEYERNEIKMNNEQLNTNIMNNNFNQPTPTNSQPSQPTFGGRFFPSLEDEPTNMNMLGANINQPIMATPSPVPNVGEQNNLIDLTDLSVDKEPINSPSMQNIQPQQPPIASTPEIPSQSVSTPQSNFGLPPQNEVPSMPTTENIVNLENLQTNAQPINQPMPDITNDFSVPTSVPESTPVPQFDMSQNVAPQTQFTTIPNLDQLNNIPQNNFDIPQEQTMAKDTSTLNMQNFSDPSPISTINSDLSLNTTIPSPETVSMAPTGKDVTPVTNMIKNLVSSLEAFGYKLNIQEEELATSKKITIEVEK